MVLRIKSQKVLLISFYITLFFNLLGFAKIINLQSASTGMIYIFMLLPIFVGGYIFFRRIVVEEKPNIKWVYELLAGFLVFVVFVGISLHKSRIVGSFTSSTWGESMRILVPFLYTFLAANILSQSDVEKLMKVTLLGAWIAYIINESITGVDFANILSISFIDSYSPFENSELAGLSFALACYFIYFRKKFPICFLWALLLSLACFKRVFVIGVILCLVITFLPKNGVTLNKRIKWPVICITTLIILFLTKFYFFTMDPRNLLWNEEKLHFDVTKFSMARSYRVAFLLTHHYVSYGLGSSTTFLNGTFGSWYTVSTLELDLVKILLELGSVALFVLILVYYRTAYGSFYSYVVITICMMNLLMASGLTNYVEWSYILITGVFIRRTESERVNGNAVFNNSSRI